MVSALTRRNESRKPKDTGKVTHYRGTGVIIEEHDSEDEDPGELSTYMCAKVGPIRIRESWAHSNLLHSWLLWE